MGTPSPAEELLKAGAPVDALARLQDQVRAHPADPKLRVFLFQLLCVLGQWKRALNQLEVASELDAGTLAMVQMYRDAVRCEVVRRAVFDGRTSPIVFGEPEQWLALLIESLLSAGQGDLGRSQSLREQAFELAPPSPGELNGQPFEWIADADSRLGPVLEAVINGRYYWVPFARLATVTLEPPADLRDIVWMPAQLEFENGGATVALIPTRYPGSESSTDGLIALARRTEWEETGPDAHRGLGQRVLATDTDELPLLEVRTLVIHGDRASAGEAAANA
jgi:type VI secretion system protein ImpE